MDEIPIDLADVALKLALSLAVVAAALVAYRTIRNAIKQCAQSIDHLEWFEVVETRGHIVDGEVAHFQVVVKLGFRIEGS